MITTRKPLNQDRSTGSPVRVLIVDDHDGYRRIAADVVASTDGFLLVGSAQSRTTAFECLASLEETPDLILMDVNLGADDGIALTEELKAARPNVEIVLVSALAKLDLPAEAETCGARGYLPKSNLSPSALIGMTRGIYDWPDGECTGSAGR